VDNTNQRFEQPSPDVIVQTVDNYIFFIEILTCSFPVTWDGTWYDSTEGTITFSRGTNQVTSGWIVTLGASSVTSWTCLAEDTSNRHFLFR